LSLARARRDFLARRTGHASINFRAQYQLIRVIICLLTPSGRIAYGGDDRPALL
jgi:hypothetical protein